MDMAGIKKLETESKNVPVIDFHAHILPEIDDGSRSARMSLQMLRSATDQGIDIVIATPHFYAGRTTIGNFLKRRDDAFNKLLRYELYPYPQIVLAAEVAFFAGIGRAEQVERLCLLGTNIMLLEMPFSEWGPHHVCELRQLLDRGIRPILAHYERFYSFQKNQRVMNEVQELPIYIQINSESLLHWGSSFRCMKLFQEENAHLLGSDCHNVTSRPENLARARKRLAERLGADRLAKMDHLGMELLAPLFADR